MQCKRDPIKIPFVHWKKWPWPIRERFDTYLNTHLLPHLPGVNLTWRWAKAGSFSKLTPALQAWIQRVLALNNSWFSFPNQKATGHILENRSLPGNSVPPWLMALAPAPPCSHSSRSVGRSALQTLPKGNHPSSMQPMAYLKTLFPLSIPRLPFLPQQTWRGSRISHQLPEKMQDGPRCAAAWHLQCPASQGHEEQPQDRFLWGCFTLSFHTSNKSLFPSLWTSRIPALCPATHVARNMRMGKWGSVAWGGAQGSRATPLMPSLWACGALLPHSFV